MAQSGPTAIGAWPLRGNAKVLSVAVQDSLAIVADSQAGVVACDISDPGCPVRLGSLAVQGAANDVKLAGGRAFVVTSGEGLVVLGFDDPRQLVRLASLADAGGSALAIEDQTAFIAQYNSGLLMLDISNPLAPRRLGAVATRGIAIDVAVSNRLACVVSVKAGLDVFDVADPAAPVWLGGLDLSGYPRGVAWYGDHVLVADETAGLTVVDLSTPANPVIVATNLIQWPRGVTVFGDRAVVVGDRGLHVLDLSLPASPRVIGNASDVSGERVIVRNEVAYVAGGLDGMRVVDLQTAASPAPRGRVLTSGHLRAVAVSGPYAYVVELESGLYVLDVSDPTQPVNVGQLYIGGNCVLQHDLVVSGQRAYLASALSGLHLIDVSNPRRPVRLGGLPARAMGVAAAGDYVYLAESHGGLQIVRVSDPANPVAVASLATGGDARAVAVAGQYVLVADFLGGLRLIDARDPENPVTVTTLLPKATAVTMQGNLAFAGFIPTLSVLDLSVPSQPMLLGQIRTNNNSVVITVAEGCAYVAGMSGAKAVLDLFDVSSPAAPRHANRLQLGNFLIGDLAAQGSLLFVAQGNGLVIYRPSLRLTTPQRQGGNLVWVVPSLANRRYILERKPHLAADTWTVQAELAGDGKPLSFEVPITAADSAFFRVREE